ncbi:MAG TPA: DUF3999 family protein [Vicinamibacterales bacterium]|nr:DUF3999 family protein [Vicinamibacterales bacterium]
MIRVGGFTGTALCLATAMLGAQSSGPALHFTRERGIATAGRGPQRLAIDTTLLEGAKPFRIAYYGDRAFAEGGLADLRLFDAQGSPVPHLLVYPPRQPTWISGTLLSVAQTKKTSGFEVDLHRADDIDTIRIEGLPAPFLKRLTLEGSGDRAHWTMLAAEGTLFDLPDDKLRQTEMHFTRGAYRYLRVTWDDTNSGRVPLPRAAFARQVAGPAPPPVPSAALTIERRPSEPGRSRYRIRLAASRLPIVALELDVEGTYVFRPAVVSESRLSGSEAIPAQLGNATLIRVVRDGAAAQALRIRIEAPLEPELELLVEDGSNPPLDLKGVSAIFAELPWIYFEAPEGPVTARFGDRNAQPPRYDLEAARESIDVATLKEASWEPVHPVAPDAGAPAPAMPETGAQIDLTAFRQVREIADKSAGLVALPLDAAVLSHSRGPVTRFADVRVVDRASRQVPYLLERRDEPLSIDVTIAPASKEQTAALPAARGVNRSVYALTLPYPNLPPGSLVVETTARVFQRNVELGVLRPPDRQRRDSWFDGLAANPWRHADQQTAAQPLTLRVPSVNATELLLIVDEGDNAPLPLGSVRLLLPSYRLRFFHPADADLRIAYGRDDLAPPQYDLTLLAAQIMGESAREISTGPERSGATTEAPLVSPPFFWGFLGVAVVALVALIVRLVKA